MPGESSSGRTSGWSRALVRLPRSHAALALAIAVAFVLPRVVALRGIRHTSPLRNIDMIQHLQAVDKIYNLRVHGPARVGEPTPNLPARWPQGVYQVAQIGVAVWGPLSIWPVQLTNALFTLVLVLGVVGLGAAIADARVGLWAGLLTVLCPALVASSWYLGLDYPLAGMVMAGLALLARTDRFEHRRPALYFAVWSALGLFVKLTYALYLLVPAGWALISGMRRRPRVVALNTALALVVTAGLTVLLQGSELHRVLAELKAHAVPTGQEAHLVVFHGWGPERWVAYARMALNNFTLPLMALAAPGVVLLHLKGKQRGLGLPLSALWGTYLLLTLLDNKMERYVQVIYPLLCLLTVWWIVDRIPPRWRTGALLSVAAAYGAVLVISTGHPIPWIIGGGRAALEGLYEMPMPRRDHLARMRATDYYDFQCELGPLLDAIAELADRDRSRGPLGVRTVGLNDDRHPLLAGRVALGLKTRLRDRYVFTVGIHPHASSPLPRSLLLIHPPGGAPVRQMERPGRVVGRATQRLTCPELEDLRLGLTLFRARTD